MTVGLGAIGGFYGFETCSGTVSALVFGFVYGIIGAAAGAPLAFAISLARNWR
jgi:hypothetical protein